MLSDFPAYRKKLTDLVWHGISPEQSPEDTIAATEELIGQPVPEDRLREARELMELMKAGGAPASE